MTVAIPLFAMIDLGLLVLKCLGVAGGASVGWIGGGAGTKILAKAALKKQSPPKLVFGSRVLAALAGGYLVALWVFGTGGGGWGFGGGPGSGGGPGTGPAGSTPSRAAKQSDPAGQAGKPDAAGTTLHIELLGGQRVKNDRFYLVAGEIEPRTLEELRKLALDRQKAGPEQAVQKLEIVIYDNSVAANHPAVKGLEDWAKRNDVAFTLRFPTETKP